MKIQSICAVGLMAGAMVVGAMPSFAVPPPPPGRVVAPGMMICPRCDGYRRVPSGFLGLKDKRCPECDGTGVVRLRHHKGVIPTTTPPPPPPKNHVKPVPQPPAHHAKPMSKPQTVHHAKPAPKSVPPPAHDKSKPKH